MLFSLLVDFPIAIQVVYSRLIIGQRFLIVMHLHHDLADVGKTNSLLTVLLVKLIINVKCV